jgi:hypothetical protein
MVSQLERLMEIVATYRKHGWRLERVLLSPRTRAEVTNPGHDVFQNASVKEASVDALWFSRPSHGEREAWELRLVSDTPYALFETFEKEEAEEDREEIRREMEARLFEHTASA